MDNNKYIDIDVAKIKGLKSNRSIRLAIQKGKYIAREIKVADGKSYEILYSSLEPEIQEKLEDEQIKCTTLAPLNNTNNRISFVSENARLTAIARIDIIVALHNLRKKIRLKKRLMQHL